MAKKTSQKTILIGAGVAVGALLIYQFFKSKSTSNAASNAAPLPSSTSSANSTSSLISSLVNLAGNIFSSGNSDVKPSASLETVPTVQSSSPAGAYQQLPTTAPTIDFSSVSGVPSSRCLIGMVGAAGPVQASAAQSKTTGADKVAVAGTALTTVGIALEAIPAVGTVAGAIVAAVGVLTGLAGKIFGSKWHENNEVRWLIQEYQYYVLGQANVTSDNKVNEAYLQDAYNWYYAVLGVPIYDRNSVMILAGLNASDGRPQNYSYEERAARYLSYPPMKQLAAGVTLDQAVSAAKSADGLKFWQDGSYLKHADPGSWANLPVASSLASQSTGQNILQSVSNGFMQNPILWGGVALGGLYLLTASGKK
jgi:hypothetical protein